MKRESRWTIAKPVELKMEDRWRFDLLSSSIPLEYDVARLLVAKNFRVRADYFCERTTDNLGDWSVDIHAERFVGRRREFVASLQLLVECKYRKPGSFMLFFEDPNDVDFSPFGYGSVVRTIDEFSEYGFPHTSDSPLVAIPNCYKGVELRPGATKKPVDDAELRHGLQQLQWAIPRLIKSHTAEVVDAMKRVNFRDELFSLNFCPILVTTSELRLARVPFSESNFLARGIEAVSKPVASVVVYLDAAPSYYEHWRTLFKESSEDVELDQLIKLGDARRRFFGAQRYQLPDRRLRQFVNADFEAVSPLSTQFLICNISAFPTLLADLIKSTSATASSRKRLTKEQRSELEKSWL